MNLTYSKALKQIPFYQIHPEYLPFVGDKFDEFKILQVGESHYIPQEKGNEELFLIAYFKEHWWEENGCEEWNTARTAALNEWSGWYCTKSVVDDYLAGKRTRAHGIFTEMVKLFSRIYTDTPIHSITKENSQAYHHFAFMNFFQMPSLYRGMSYWDSLLRSAKKIYKDDKKCAEKYACEVWDETARRSKNVLDQVIDILDPQVIIFTSNSAYEEYIRQNGKHVGRNGLFHCVHPGCRYWHKPTANQIGKQELENKLNALL